MHQSMRVIHHSCLEQRLQGSDRVLTNSDSDSRFTICILKIRIGTGVQQWCNEILRIFLGASM